MTPRAIAIIVPGEPIPKQSFRFRYSGRHFVAARIRAAQDQVAWCARQAMAGEPPLAGPVSVVATFARKSHRQVDVDNLWKLAGDALQGIVFEDDAQIEYLELTKSQVERLDEAKTIIEVESIADGSRP